MRYYLIAGEASGDLHGSNLIRELKSRDPNASFRCWGGDLMEQQGATLVKHYRGLAFMGFMEVVSHLPEILRNFRLCEKDLLEYRPDVVILIDYPGFNLRMAKFAKTNRLQVFYYISPQLWAWHSSRVKQVKKWIDRMFVILPFEQAFYAGYDIQADFLGHPLLDVINDEMKVFDLQAFLELNALPARPIIALLPGSRKMEITQMLEVMVSASTAFPEYQFVIAGAPSIQPGFYAEILKDTDIRVVFNQTHFLLSHAAGAIVTSGTATLEAALLGVPQVVCYRGNAISYLIARKLVNVRYISLVNLVCDRTVVPELIQNHLTRQNLVDTLSSLIQTGPVRDEVIAGYAELKKKLGGPGASSRVAGAMIQYLVKK
jgi:lipid-A-disaccharide synthase